VQLALGLGVIQIGFWKWLVIPFVTLCAALGMWRSQGDFVRYYQAQAILQTTDPATALQDLGRFQSESYRRATGAALGWIQDKSTPEQIQGTLNRLTQVLAWRSVLGSHDQLIVTGIGKDRSGIAWVVNTAARASIKQVDDPVRWSVRQSARAPSNPIRYDGWKPVAQAAAGGFVLGIVLFGGWRRKVSVTLLPTLAAETSEQIPVTPVAQPQTPIPLQVIHPEALDWSALYKQWCLCAEQIYNAKDHSPSVSVPQIDALIQNSLSLCTEGVAPLLKQLSASLGEASLVRHAVHTALMALAWAYSEGIAEEELRILTYGGLLQAWGLREMPVAQALRAHPEASRVTAPWVESLKDMPQDLQCALPAILIRLGRQAGMHPATTAADETSQRLAKTLSQLIREEKILRRKALLIHRRKALVLPLQANA